MDRPVGLIAAGGRLPIATAHGIHATGRRVVCIGLRDQFDPQLPPLCDGFKTAGLIQIGRWVRCLRRWDVEEAVMVGKVVKVRMYDPFYLFRQMPDWRAARLWFGRLRHDKRNDAILTAVADTLAEEGIRLIDTTRYIPQELAGEGVLTSAQPTAAQRADVDFALPIIARMGDLDVGQSIAVKDREIIAVEAIEGTDRMIERAGQLCRRGGWTLVKIAKPQQDMRFDVPVIGLNTVEKMKGAGGTCIAVEAGRTIVLDKVETLAAADHAGIAIMGVKLQPIV